MAKETTSRLAQIYRHKTSASGENKGAISGLASAIGGRIGEKLDPRNYLFGGTGVGSQLGKAIFGKGYKAAPERILSGKGSGDFASALEKTNEILIEKLNETNSHLMVIGKRVFPIPAINRDTNIIRQNVSKISKKVTGEKAVSKTDMFFTKASEREAQYESKIEKEKASKTPTKEKASKTPESPKGFFAQLFENIIIAIKEMFSLKNIMKAIPVALLLASLFNGIKSAWDEWSESGDLGKAAKKFLSGLTFGLISEEFIDENIIKPVTDFIENVVSLFNEYIANPISKAIENISIFVNDIFDDALKTYEKLKLVIGDTLEKSVNTLKEFADNPIQATKKFFNRGKDEKSSPPAPAPAPISGSATSPTPAKMATTQRGAVTGIAKGMGLNKDLVITELKKAGYSEKAQANILAQVQSESGFKPRSEELDKYSAETLFKLWPTKFKTLDDAKEAKKKGTEYWADIVYGGRMGNKDPGDGYKYRGRGFIQITGRDAYEKIGKMIGIDLVNNPDLANDPAIAAKIVPAFFKYKGVKSPNELENNSRVNTLVGFADPTGKKAAERNELANSIMASMSGAATATTGGSGVSLTPQSSGVSPKLATSSPKTSGESISTASTQINEAQRTQVQSGPPIVINAPQQTTNVAQNTTSKEKDTSFNVMDEIYAKSIFA